MRDERVRPGPKRCGGARGHDHGSLLSTAGGGPSRGSYSTESLPRGEKNYSRSDDLTHLLGILDILDASPVPIHSPSRRGGKWKGTGNRKIRRGTVHRDRLLGLRAAAGAQLQVGRDPALDPPRRRRTPSHCPSAKASISTAWGPYTLLGVEPDPIMSTPNVGGSYYTINLTLDPGVTLRN